MRRRVLIVERALERLSHRRAASATLPTHVIFMIWMLALDRRVRDSEADIRVRTEAMHHEIELLERTRCGCARPHMARDEIRDRRAPGRRRVARLGGPGGSG